MGNKELEPLSRSFLSEFSFSPKNQSACVSDGVAMAVASSVFVPGGKHVGGRNDLGIAPGCLGMKPWNRR